MAGYVLLHSIPQEGERLTLMSRMAVGPSWGLRIWSSGSEMLARIRKDA
jgi:hypothetical protein